MAFAKYVFTEQGEGLVVGRAGAGWALRLGATVCASSPRKSLLSAKESQAGTNGIEAETDTSADTIGEDEDEDEEGGESEDGEEDAEAKDGEGKSTLDSSRTQSNPSSQA